MKKEREAKKDVHLLEKENTKVLERYPFAKKEHNICTNSSPRHTYDEGGDRCIKLYLPCLLGPLIDTSQS